MKMEKIISISCCLLFLTACQMTDTSTAEYQKQALQNSVDKQVEQLIIPADIESELYAELSEQTQTLSAEEKRVDISARDVDARVFFTSLIHDS